MKVLWITNVLLPEVKGKLCVSDELRGSGGWILSLADALSTKSDINLHIATITSMVKTYKRITGNRITYHLIPVGKGNNSYNKEYERCYRVIYEKECPEVVHIHGTEYPHSLAALRACGSEHTVVSIQGLVSVIASHYLGGISPTVIRNNITIRDLVKTSLIKQQKEMAQRGEYEKILLKEAKHVIGRTSWDRAHTWAANPDCNYYHCDEILRDEFYSGKWQYEKCKPHSIFVSQSNYPLKGLHKLLDAIAIVKKHYPDITLRIAGYDFSYRNSSFTDRFRLSSYGKLINNKLLSYGINDRVEFTGQLNATEMKNEYLMSNVFVCPSCIENSSNSLGEAQLLGVPSVASFVGGVQDLIPNTSCGELYRYEEVEMLAQLLCKVFEDSKIFDNSIMCSVAAARHDKVRIANQLLFLYSMISKRL